MIGYTGKQGENLVIPTVFQEDGIWYRVTSIGDYAFEDCTSLTSVNIPDSVTSIGIGAFAVCDALTSLIVESENPVYYSEGNCIITRNEKVLIQGCNNSVISQDIMSIGDFAFYYCTSLTSVTIPDSVTSIGKSAFEYCSSLTSVTIPDSVTSIGNYAFSGCNNLVGNEYDNAYYLGNDQNPCLLLLRAKSTTITSCTIHKDTRFIHNHAFYNCTSLTSVTIPDSVTSIGVYAFRECTSLTSVTIPDSVTSIGYGAFYGCTSLTSVTISDSVTSIGDSAFSGCDSLTNVTFANPNGWECENIHDATRVIAISASDLSNPATAAQYLKSTYLSYYWFRIE
jgi:hypothetical protein